MKASQVKHCKTMDNILYNILNSYTFVYVVMPLIGAIICMMSNITNKKDQQIPKSPDEKWKETLFEFTNFVTIWMVIMIIMQVYKSFLKNTWGIN